LSPQSQEVIGRGGTLHYLHVGLSNLFLDLVFFQNQSGIVLAELKESFHSPGRMFRALAVHSVRQKQHQTKTLIIIAKYEF
jgi:hypothetical protein